MTVVGWLHVQTWCTIRLTRTGVFSRTCGSAELPTVCSQKKKSEKKRNHSHRPQRQVPRRLTFSRSSRDPKLRRPATHKYSLYRYLARTCFFHSCITRRPHVHTHKPPLCISVGDFTVHYDHTSPSGGASPHQTDRQFSSFEAARGGNWRAMSEVRRGQGREGKGGEKGDSPPGVTELRNVGVPSFFVCFL